MDAESDGIRRGFTAHLSTVLKVIGALILLGVWGFAGPRYGRLLTRWGAPRGEVQSPTLGDRQPGELAVAFLAVGYGRAVLVQGPGSTTTLVGGGIGQYPRETRMPVEDAAHRVLLPWIRGTGVRRLYQLVGTVPRDHHLGAAVDLLEHPSPAVNRLLVPPARTPVVRALRKRARERGVPVEPLPMEEPFELVPGAPARILNRPPIVHVGRPVGHALFFRYGQRSFLLAGDLDRSTERTVVMRWGDSLRTDVLAAARHGREDGSDPLLLRRVRPRHVVVPTGRPNPYEAPAVRVMERLKRHAEGGVYRTDRRGTVVFYTDGRTLRVRTGVDGP